MASTLTTTGLGSGLDVQGLVTKLVAAERGSADARLSKQDSTLNTQLSSVSKLRGAMAQLQTTATALKDASALVLRSAYSEDYGVLSATASSTATAGTYDIEVKQLATAAKITSAALASSSSASVEKGTFSVTQGSTTFNVVINSTNNTLSGLRDAINSAAGTSGVTATLINASDGTHLQIAGGATGAANALSFSSSNAAGSGDVRLAALFTDRQVSAEYSSSSKILQNGTLTVAQGGSSVAVSLNGTTLQDFVTAFNAAAGSTGLSASLVATSGGGYRVALAGSAANSGTPITLSASIPHSSTYDVSLSSFISGQTTQQVQKTSAVDSNVLISGIAASSSSNTLTDVIAGVTLTVSKVSTAGTTTALTISNNDTAVKSKVNDFVSAYNQLSSTMAALGGYEPVTKTAGPMLSDSLLLSIQSQVRRAIGTTSKVTGSSYTTLASLGIVSKADGQLAVDATKLQSALTADSKAASSVISGTTGVAAAFAELMDKHTASTGDISSREATIATRRKDLTKQKAALDARMVDFQARQLKTFNSLDGMLSKMQTTSSQLTQSLSKLSSG